MNAISARHTITLRASRGAAHPTEANHTEANPTEARAHTDPQELNSRG
ncbi:hypothetical protein CU044_1756 [Streptomyces sp. L-9-10]|nr:hypothetical protein [Streptomyces sp. L-9-10]RYJ29932.1 hypothetical protein CU044_1756 [Streptomyces sp. L-9-10]